MLLKDCSQKLPKGFNEVVMNFSVLGHVLRTQLGSFVPKMVFNTFLPLIFRKISTMPDLKKFLRKGPYIKYDNHVVLVSFKRMCHASFQMKFYDIIPKYLN